MLEILPNTAMKYASLEAVSTPGGGVSTGYDIADGEYGPRSKVIRLDATGSTNRIGYRFNTPFAADYCIIAGAHYLLTDDTTYINSVELDESNTWVIGSGSINKGPLSSGDVTFGPKSQDFISEISTSSRAYYGFGLDTNSVGTEAAQLCKFYVSKAFDFGVEVSKSAARYKKIRDKDREFFPMRAYFPYDTQAVIQARMLGVTSAKCLEFDQLIETDRLFERAFFLYDKNAYLLKDKLYHVVLEDYKKRVENWGFWSVDLQFRVLRYYD